MRVNQKRVGLAGVALALLVATIGLAGANDARAATSNVTIQNFQYQPSTLQVAVGDTVVWTNQDAVPHTVTSPGSSPLNSGLLNQGNTYSFTFQAAGTYTYSCQVHPTMNGSVQVSAATATPTPATTGTVPATASPTATSAPPTATPTTPGTAPTSSTPPSPIPTGTTVPTQPANAPINVPLRGAEEVPPVTTSATGVFLATASSTSLSYTLRATGTGLTMAHIHLGAKGTNGPVVAFLFGPNAAGVSSIDVSGVITEQNLIGPLAGKMSDFQAALRNGQLYVNVHSLANPAGEIRGQIPGTPPTAPGTGNVAATDDAQPLLPLFVGGAIALLAALAGAGWVVARRR